MSGGRRTKSFDWQEALREHHKSKHIHSRGRLVIIHLKTIKPQFFGMEMSYRAYDLLISEA